MRYLSLIATILLQFLAVVKLKILDNFSLILGIVISCLVIGVIIFFPKAISKKRIAKTIGWGLFYGSLISLSLFIAFVIWLSFNFPK